MNELVLWHGWGMHPAAWDGLAAHLKIQARAPALPGYAGSAAPSLYTMDALTDALLADVSTPITLCGWSLGALLALHAAQRQPDRIARLILIGATPSFVQRPNWPHGMTPAALAEFTDALEADPKTALKRFIALFNQNDVNGRSIGRELTRALATADLPPAAVLAAGLALLRYTDLRANVPHIAQPTLLLHGAHDPLMPLAAAEWLAAALPQARLEVLPDAAHAPFLSDPARCAALIADFINA
ncbi:alpha/beta fold hydrolase [Herminiimonas sp. CN]|uniref:alpha/beta fold hydrolase n=1 Tax=Herminiimonas sp. CN TaxID=1349818 RepID=UPI0004730D68|nr:alpha/beta fold hydrolase [Herminiimonas sp. CN]